MAFDELAVDHAGVARPQPRHHAQFLLDRAHVGFDVIAHLEAVGLQVLDPVFTTATVGVAMNVNDLGGLDATGHEQRGNDSKFGPGDGHETLPF